jgi:hypothetical protein
MRLESAPGCRVLHGYTSGDGEKDYLNRILTVVCLSLVFASGERGRAECEGQAADYAYREGCQDYGAIGG